LINSSTKIWKEISEVNNLEFEYHLLPGNVPILIANNVFLYPDKVQEFLESLDYWETKDFDDSDIVRPGMTHQFTPNLFSMLGHQLTQKFKKIFGVNDMSIIDMYTQATSGTMGLDVTGGLCCYPHMDSDPFDSIETERPCIVANINLSKSSDPVTTGFWSWRGKNNVLDFNREDKNTLINFYDRHEEQSIDKWFQVHDYEDFKFESSATMMYNSLVVYPTGCIHNPYIKPNWFSDKERIVLSAFYSIQPENLDFEEKNADIVSYTWEHFRLDTLFNYHPQFTSPQS
jgi:hypothetical protein